MKGRIRIAILTMGFSGLVAEILLLRELLIVFSGNELCIGIVLANWLILEALGCFLLRRKAAESRNGPGALAVISILFSLSLFVAVFLTRILKTALSVSVGESIGFVTMLYSSLAILLPVAFLHGALFTFSCRVYAMVSGQDVSAAGTVYAYETVGTIAGGVACTYLLIPYLNTFRAFSGLALMNMIASLVLVAPYWKTGPSHKTIVVALGALTLAYGYLFLAGQADRLHQLSISSQWRGQNLVHYQNSPYGNICVIENQGQYVFFQDGVPSVMTPILDVPFVEEFVHLPLLAHPEPRRLLVLSGGAGGVIHEALRHPSVEAIEYAELDPLLLELFRRFPTALTESELNDRRVKTRHIDGRLLVQTTRDTYDVILVGIKEPSTLQENRFFTEEFFFLAEARLNAGGMFVLSLPGSLTYSNEELRNLNSCILRTLRGVFAHIRVIPGDGTNLYLSSDSEEVLAIDRMQVLERANQRGIQADVTLPWYIEKKLHPGRQDWFSSFVEGGSERINSDLNPVGLFYSISYWNALFAPSLRWLFRQFERMHVGIVVLLVAVPLLPFLFLRPRGVRFLRASIPLSVVTTGFAGMVFDLMLIFTFQSIHGYVFSWIGVLVASFMAGAACGAALVATVLPLRGDCYKPFAKVDLAIACYAIGCPLALLAVHRHLGSPGAPLGRMLFLVASFIGGILIGSQFPLANRIYSGNGESLSGTAGLLYAADLLGGWLGGVAGAVVLLPILGLVGTGIAVAVLKLTSFVILAFQPSRLL